MEFVLKLLRSGGFTGVLAISALSPAVVHAAPTPLPGEIAASTVLTTAKSPYIAHGSVTVDNKAILTVQPGVVIKFDQGAKLQIGGGEGSPGFLIAKGVKAGPGGAPVPAPIHFLATLANPTHGYWSGIVFNNSQYRSVMDHCDVSNAGAGGDPAIRVNSGEAPTITNCSITWGDGDGVQADGSFTSFDGNIVAHFKGIGMNISSQAAGAVGSHNKLVANGHDYIRLTGDVSQDEHWTNSAVPFFSDSGFKVEAAAQDKDATLTLDPGVHLIFAHGQKFTLGWNNTGSLKAVGTADKPVVFSGDPDWAGIDASKGKNITLDHCLIEKVAPDERAFHASAGNIALTNTTIDNGGKVGVSAESDARFTAFHGNTITGMKDVPVEIDADQAPGLEADNKLTGNARDVARINAGTVAADSEWKLTAAPFLASNGIKVESAVQDKDVTLTIDPGVQIVFATGQKLTLGWNNSGSLSAAGTADKPVVFSGDPDWEGIQTSKCTKLALDHCVIEKAAADESGLHVSSGAITVTNSTIGNGGKVGILGEDKARFTAFHGNTVTGVKGVPVQVDARVAAGLEPDNKLTGNTLDVVRIADATVDADGEWRFTAVPYLASNGIKVEAPDGTDAVTLTLDPGVTIRFADNQDLTLGWNNQGCVKAVGTAQAPIVLTSSQKTPNKGDWSGINFSKSGADTDLEGVRIEYAGSKGGDAALRGNGDSRGQVSGCTIAHSGNGVDLAGTKVKVTGLQFDDVDSGATAAPAQ